MSRFGNFRAATVRALASGTTSWERATASVNSARANAVPATFGGGGGGAILPASAQGKLDALREQKDEQYAVVRALTDRVESARLEVHDAERELRRVQANDSPANQLPDDDQQVMRARAKVERATVDFARLVERRDARTAVWQAVAKVVETAERWIAALPAGERIEPVETETPKLGKAETVADAVKRLQRKRADLLADLRAVDAAPITSATAKAIARAEIEALADRGRPDLFGLIEHGEGVRWPQVNTAAPLMGFVAAEGAPQIQGQARFGTVDALALLAWMHKDALLAALDVEIDQVADDAAALSDTERSDRRAEVLASVLDTERSEVALLDSDPTATYRPDTDPRALLAVTGPAPQA